MNVNTKHCNKEMVDLGEMEGLCDQNTNYCRRFICGECGSHLDIISYDMDDDDLIDEIESDERLKNLNYTKRLNEG